MPDRHQTPAARALDERLQRIDRQLVIIEGQLAIILRDIDERKKDLLAEYRRGYQAGYSRGHPERNAPVPRSRRQT